MSVSEVCRSSLASRFCVILELSLGSWLPVLYQTAGGLSRVRRILRKNPAAACSQQQTNYFSGKADPNRVLVRIVTENLQKAAPQRKPTNNSLCLTKRFLCLILGTETPPAPQPGRHRRRLEPSLETDIGNKHSRSGRFPPIIFLYALAEIDGFLPTCAFVRRILF